MVARPGGGRVLFAFGVLRVGFPREWDPDPFVLVTVFGLYAIALFRFHALDPVPLARTAVIEQMREGLVVVDVRGADRGREPERGARLGAVVREPSVVARAPTCSRSTTI